MTYEDLFFSFSFFSHISREKYKRIRIQNILDSDDENNLDEQNNDVYFDVTRKDPVTGNFVKRL